MATAAGGHGGNVDYANGAATSDDGLQTGCGAAARSYVGEAATGASFLTEEASCSTRKASRGEFHYPTGCTWVSWDDLVKPIIDVH